jgi:hypothetical protein
MACAVYCLVARPDQLDPLVDRLKDAGVRTRDISVVLRDPPMAGPPLPVWWPLLWPLSLYEWSGGVPRLPSEGQRVIPLARYRARADSA